LTTLTSSGIIQGDDEEARHVLATPLPPTLKAAVNGKEDRRGEWKGMHKISGYFSAPIIADSTDEKKSLNERTSSGKNTEQGEGFEHHGPNLSDVVVTTLIADQYGSLLDSLRNLLIFLHSAGATIVLPDIIDFTRGMTCSLPLPHTFHASKMGSLRPDRDS
jgi:hypothetical protein